MRGVPGITTAMDHPLGVELLGGENQLDRVKAGKPFAQLRPAGMTAAAMEEALRRRIATPKSTTRCARAGQTRCHADSVDAARTIYRCVRVTV